MAVSHAFYPGLILLSLACATVADDDNLWIYPTEPGPSDNFVANPAWSLGSKQTIEWTTTLDSYYIALFQQQIDPASGIQIESIYTVGSSGAGDRSFKWTVQTYDADRTKSPVYFFWINPGSPTGFTSHYFNITEDDAASAVVSSTAVTSSTASQSTTSSTASSSAAPSSVTLTSSTATGILATSARTATASPTSASTSSTIAADNSTANSSDTSVINVALGVGLGLGIPLVLLAGIWIGLKAVRQRRAASRNGDHDDAIDSRGRGGRGTGGDWPMEPLPGIDHKHTPVVEAPYFQRTAEAPDSQSSWPKVHEAPSDPPPPIELESGQRRWT